MCYTTVDLDRESLFVWRGWAVPVAGYVVLYLERPRILNLQVHAEE